MNVGLFCRTIYLLIKLETEFDKPIRVFWPLQLTQVMYVYRIFLFHKLTSLELSIDYPYCNLKRFPCKLLRTLFKYLY